MRCLCRYGALCVFALSLLAAPAFADGTTSTGTGNAQLTGGSLAIGTTTDNTIQVGLENRTGTGVLPTAVWSDATGSGAGWNGTVAVSDFTYTGTWSTTTGTPLVTTTSGAYTGTQDGVVYTVQVSTVAENAVTFTYTSTNSTDPQSTAAQHATVGTAAPVGTLGLTITFPSSMLDTSVYQIQAGTQASGALSLSSAESSTVTSTNPAPGVVVADGSVSAPPVLVTATTTVAGTDVAAQTFGTAVKFAAAAANTGMGSYTVNPGVSFTADVNSWAATYTANVEYSIVSGP